MINFMEALFEYGLQINPESPGDSIPHEGQPCKKGA